MNRKTKTSIIIFIYTFLSMNLNSFDWPLSSNKLFSYFGQLRGNTISNSLIFADADEIKSADDGNIIFIISEYQDDSVFFPSTLGNAVIISHADNLLTVYANIDADSIPDGIKEVKEISKETVLGETGNSSWQQGKSSLEFQVIDTKNNTAINPSILMPRQGKEPPLYISDVILQKRSGKRFSAANQPYLASGFYQVYHKRQKTAVPYKSRLSINGTLIDEISYDVIRQDVNITCVSGRKNYPKSVLYPDDSLQLLGEATFSPGKNALTLTLLDILGKEYSSTYIINNY